MKKDTFDKSSHDKTVCQVIKTKNNKAACFIWHVTQLLILLIIFQEDEKNELLMPNSN